MRVLMISADNFEDTELLVPLYRLQEAEIDVDVAAPAPGTIKGKHGYEVKANRSVDDVAADDYDLLVLPGGKAPATLRTNERVLALARDFFARDKPVGAICHGPQILVSAGLVEGRSATAYAKVQPELEEASTSTATT